MLTKPNLSLDLSSAFDIFDHGILMEELFHCGIWYSVLALLKSCLEDQYQHVVIGSVVPESSLIHWGVPQGSVIGPILFLVYTHSLTLLLASDGVFLFFSPSSSINCQIYLPIANMNENKTDVLALLSDIKTWMREWKLKLNESKTEIMLIKCNSRATVTLEFGNLDVETSTLRLLLWILHEILCQFWPWTVARNSQLESPEKKVGNHCSGGYHLKLLNKCAKRFNGGKYKR